MAALSHIVFRAARYRRNCERVARAHYLTAVELRQRHFWLGILALLLTTFVGTAIFSSLESEPDLWAKIVTGLVSLTAAFLAASQTFLNYSERAEKQKSAGANYSAMRREFELFILRYNDSPTTERDAALSDLRLLHDKLTSLAEEAPSIPDKHWDKADKEVAPVLTAKDVIALPESE